MSKYLILLGIALVVLGLLWPMLGKLGFGRLPGDFVFERENLRVYLPLATCLVVSALLSLVLWFINR
jgi:hypothetical protein